MDTVVFVTIGVVLATGLMGAYLRGLRIDACLHSFETYMVTIRLKNGKRMWGALDVEPTGVELKYRKENRDKQGHFESSYIIYKNELSNVDVVIRYVDELAPDEVAKRNKIMRRSFHPSFSRRLRRKFRNIFNTTKDAVTEALTLAASSVRVGGKAASGTALASQQKMVSRTGTEAAESFGNVYDPILEKHVGKTVVLEVLGPAGRRSEFVGVLREYSPEYLEVMDVNFSEDGEDGSTKRKADLLVPRLHGFIRHSGEPISSISTQAVMAALHDQGVPAPAHAGRAPAIAVGANGSQAAHQPTVSQPTS
jgi:hypothetical protein